MQTLRKGIIPMKFDEQNLEQVKRSALDDIGEYLLEQVKIYAVRRSIMMARHPGAERVSQEFLDSFGYTVDAEGTIHIGTNKEHAKFLEWGTKPYDIHAPPGGVLAWTAQGMPRPTTSAGWKEAKKGGVAFYAKQVKHPGIKARHFMRDSVLDSKPEILKRFGLHIQLIK